MEPFYDLRFAHTILTILCRTNALLQVPWAAILPRPHQHVEMAEPSRPRACFPIPWAAMLPRPAADRLYLQANAGRGNPGDPPAGARSLSKILSFFGRNWDAAVTAGTIHARPKGGRQGAHALCVLGDDVALKVWPI